MPTDDVLDDELEDAKNLLNYLFHPGKPVALDDALAEAEASGIRWRAVLLARRLTSAVAARDADGAWIWSPPPGFIACAGALDAERLWRPAAKAREAANAARRAAYRRRTNKLLRAA
ncbi:MAG: hypothetical protein EOR22_23640 [Mesorhizobium sp.]|nr:MAG: hypothetical protein EOR22_23640 [Mesorhizobium sp.]